MTIAKKLLSVVGIYIIFALCTSTLPHIFPKALSKESKEALESQLSQFYASEARSDKIALMQDMTQAYNIRIQLLRAAESSIDMVCYAVQEGPSADAFMGEIIKAADRGVSVRILLDGKMGTMSAQTRGMLAALDEHENISYARFNPIRLTRPWEWHTTMHDKFMIVDDEYLLLGGRNLGDRFFSPEGYSGKKVDDWEALVFADPKGAGVMPQARKYLEELWQSPRVVPHSGGSQKVEEEWQRLAEAAIEFEKENPAFYFMTLEDYRDRAVPAKITLLHNPIHIGQKEPWVGYQLRKVAEGARESLLIQTPYSTANPQLLSALAECGERVDLVMLTNSLASSPNFPAFSNYQANRRKFLRTGASIYEYQSTDSIHGKAMVIDGRYSALGSLNLDDRSLYIDTETMLLVDSPAFAAELSEAMGQYMENSLKVGIDNQYEENNEVTPLPVSGIKRGIMFVVSLFSRLFQFLI